MQSTYLSSSEKTVPSYFSVIELDVFQKLEEVKAQKASGSDKVPNIILKKAYCYISKPLCYIFNKIVQNSTFPSSWKLADISPIPKCKPPQIDKLRPISLLPTVSKVFERLLLDKIQPIFLPQIYNNQFGFMPKSSTDLLFTSYAGNHRKAFRYVINCSSYYNIF